MSLVTVVKISISFVSKQVFDGIGFQLEAGDRIGLVGPNGSGKTTLLRLLAGQILPDKGEIRFSKGARIGYLPQDIQETMGGQLQQSILDSIPGRIANRRALRIAERALDKCHDKQQQTNLAQDIAEIHHRLNQLELEFPQHDAEKILLGLGFSTDDFQAPMASLSGGWKMRGALAGLLYQKPDLLLLDEPTNHLDIPSVHWLEHFLQEFQGAIVLVSHDSDFLNRQVNRILSFETEGVRSYTGNYLFYVKAREEEEKALAARARNQEQKVKEAQKFIERFRAKASKARQAQSKIKLLQKIEMVETHKRTKTIRFRFPEVPRSGREVLSLKGVSKHFGEKRLYDGLDLRILRGERIAVIGPNGCGKTTLLKMVAGEIEPSHGEIHFGHGVGMSYFAQHHADVLDPAKSILQEVYQAVPEQGISFIRGVCGAFLFSGEDVDKPIGVLSGGERARVSLAKLLVKPGNFMVMDEPTNHLDLSSSEILIDALKDYRGTLLFVSHNQSFINRLASKIWDIRGNEVFEYHGTLDEYYDHLDRMELDRGVEIVQARSDSAEKAAGEAGQNARNRKHAKRERAEKRRLIQDTLKPILSDLEEVEKEILELETRQKDLEEILADPAVLKDKQRSVPLINEYNTDKKRLDELLEKWERCEAELESTKEKLGI
jgi:ATP-binding cassette subfamily F protein 3